MIFDKLGNIIYGNRNLRKILNVESDKEFQSKTMILLEEIYKFCYFENNNGYREQKNPTNYGHGVDSRNNCDKASNTTKDNRINLNNINKYTYNCNSDSQNGQNQLINSGSINNNNNNNLEEY